MRLIHHPKPAPSLNDKSHGLRRPKQEKRFIQTVESGYMTKDLALLIGPDQPWLSTTGFLDKIDENLQKAMAA